MASLNSLDMDQEQLLNIDIPVLHEPDDLKTPISSDNKSLECKIDDYQQLKIQEAKYPLTDYMYKIPAINIEMYNTLANWLLEVSIVDKHNKHIIFLTISIFHRYMHFISETNPNYVSKKNLQLIGTSCLEIANKLITSDQYGIAKLIELSGNAYTHAEFTKQELDIVSALKFRFSLATAYKFIVCTNSNDILLLHLAYLSLLQYEFIKYSPSKLADICIYLIDGQSQNSIDEQTKECINLLHQTFNQIITQNTELSKVFEPTTQQLSALFDNKHTLKRKLFSDNSSNSNSSSDSIPNSIQKIDEGINRISNSTPKYKSIRKIGEGTYSTVYMGCKITTDEANNQKVAIKKYRSEDSDTNVNVTTLRELSILQELDHPNIISILNVYIDENDTIRMVMDLFPATLQNYLDRKYYKITIDIIKQWMYMILDGLNYLHSNNVMHRDIKPSNILVGPQLNQLKIADFGFAKQISKEDRRHSPQIYSLYYRPPEILLGVKEYDTSVDIWSIGCIMAEIINRKFLFPGDNEIDQLFRIFKIMGAPSDTLWPAGTKLPNYALIFPKWTAQPIQTLVPNFHDLDGLDLLGKLLVLDPIGRITARDALNHPFLKERGNPFEPLKGAAF